jgi:predicted AAA+ superfamily ATPase
VIFDRSHRKQEQNPKKLFPVDLGLMQAFTVRPDQDLGRKLENVVYLKKRASPGSIFYLSSPVEIDVVHSGADGDTFTNVCWTMETPEAVRRELGGLELAAQRFPTANVELIAHDRGQTRFPAQVQAWRDWEYLLR